MTLVERIISKHANNQLVTAGDFVYLKVDRICIQDANSPTIRRLFDLSKNDSEIWKFSKVKLVRV